MVLTLNYFAGAESGSIAEADHGTVGNDTGNSRTGSRFFSIANNNGGFDPFTHGISDAGSNYVTAFGFRVTDLTPTTAIDIWEARQGTINPGPIKLRLRTDGDFALVDANGTEIDTWTPSWSFGTWLYFEIYWENGASAVANVFVDDVQVMSATAADFDATGANYTRDYFSAPSGEEIFIDDYYVLSGATAPTDRYGPTEVLPYRGDATTATVVSGSAALDVGNWEDVSDINVVTDAAEYNGGAQSGGVETDGIPSGPSGDSNVDGTIRGGKWSGLIRRGNGGGTTHFLKVGNTGDGFGTDITISLGTGFTYQSFVSEGVDVPTSSEFFQIGIGKTAGNREIVAAELICELLHSPPAAGPSFPDELLTRRFNPTHLRM